jgi:hypothetical protein
MSRIALVKKYLRAVAEGRSVPVPRLPSLVSRVLYGVSDIHADSAGCFRKELLDYAGAAHASLEPMFGTDPSYIDSLELASL